MIAPTGWPREHGQSFMSKLTSNPLVLIALGLILGVGTGMVSFWKMAAPLVAAGAGSSQPATHVEKPEAPWDFWTSRNRKSRE